MINVVLLGFGNLNLNLCRAFIDAENVEIKQIYNRNPIKLETPFKSIPFTEDLSKLMEADVYIIGIPDDDISGFSESLPIQNRLVVHTSGAMEMDQLAHRNRKGVLYPLQTFSKHRKVDFKNIPICIEAENKTDLEMLEKLGNSISENTIEISTSKRARLHLAAVFVNNFVNYLYQIGDEILTKEALSFDLLKPLIFETASKIEYLSPAEAQTGPARRKDQKTIDKHLQMLQNSPNSEFYELFTKALRQK